jgi:hypothetical protein
MKRGGGGGSEEHAQSDKTQHAKLRCVSAYACIHVFRVCVYVVSYEQGDLSYAPEAALRRSSARG